MTTKKMVQLALLVSLAGILHFVEALLPMPLPVPGLKVGLANIITLFVIVRYGLLEALLVCGLRVILGTAMTGSLFSLPFLLGVAGALAACLTMQFVLRKWVPPFSLVGVSILGAVSHNLAQIFIVMVVLNLPDLVYYIPYLMLFAVLTGTITGILISTLLRRLPSLNEAIK